MWTCDDLVDLVAIETEAPTGQTRLTASQVLRLATKELWGIITPLLTTSAGHFFEKRVVFNLTSAEQEYIIPSRAIGGRIALVEGGSNGAYANMPIADPSEMATKGWVGGSIPSNPVCYIRNDRLVILGGPNTFNTVRVTYFERTGALIPTVDARQIITVNPGSIVLSSSIATIVTGTSFDIVSKNSSYPYRGVDLTGTVAGSTITMTPPAETAVGDWVCLSGYSPIPQIPLDLHPVLIERVVGKVLETLGDREGMQASYLSAQTYLQQFMNLVAPRFAQNSKKIVSPYAYGYNLPGSYTTRG